MSHCLGTGSGTGHIQRYGQGEVKAHELMLAVSQAALHLSHKHMGTTDSESGGCIRRPKGVFGVNRFGLGDRESERFGAFSAGEGRDRRDCIRRPDSRFANRENRSDVWRRVSPKQDRRSGAWSAVASPVAIVNPRACQISRDSVWLPTCNPLHKHSQRIPRRRVRPSNSARNACGMLARIDREALENPPPSLQSEY